MLTCDNNFAKQQNLVPEVEEAAGGEERLDVVYVNRYVVPVANILKYWKILTLKNAISVKQFNKSTIILYYFWVLINSSRSRLQKVKLLGDGQ